MRTLHSSLRVTSLQRSLFFYSTLGYLAIGSIEIEGGITLVFLRFPDETVVTLELQVYPDGVRVEPGDGFQHLAIQVDNLAATVDRLMVAGLDPGPIAWPGGPDGPQTAWLTDPDGYRLELVEWPTGHAHGLTDADFS